MIDLIIYGVLMSAFPAVITIFITVVFAKFVRSLSNNN